MRTIRVTGNASIKLPADVIIFNIYQTAVFNTYEEAYNNAFIAKTELDEAFEKADLDSGIIKTDDLRVKEEYESKKVKGEYKNIFVGYRYRHDMHFEVDLNHELLTKIYGLLRKLKSAPEIRTDVTLKNPEAAENELIAKAVKDSRVKAEVLCEALDCSLKEVVDISYSWSKIEVYESRDCLDMTCEVAPMSKICNFSFDDIDLNDSVTVIWAIE